MAEFRLVHYGAPEYRPEMFKPVLDVPFRNKAMGGLWTSPVNSEYGWRDWCKAEEYGDLSQYFEVDFVGSVLTIDSVDDMNALPWIESNGTHFISFQALCALGFAYDAIHLTSKGQDETRFTRPRSLYGWDCETVFVMNPEAITPISANTYRPDVEIIQENRSMKKAKYSKKDSRGALFVDCSECNRGGNGADKDKCASGWKVKRGKKGGCFLGVLIDGIED